ncbi:hypothetical protein CK203_001233 [Vitis vinifera]|uniref:Uncharacterized protein n=1 Tax=Vitis vinifera TaxID=29760 RepID=A0A438KLX9_VITVI|nr:hypothetical protein CK203_001233 [Vitis vinifera]
MVVTHLPGTGKANIPLMLFEAELKENRVVQPHFQKSRCTSLLSGWRDGLKSHSYKQHPESLMAG